MLLATQTPEVPAPEEVAEYAADLRNILQGGSLTEKKAFIRSFVTDIRITGDAAKLTYTLPVSTRGTREETVPVLAIVHHGGPLCSIDRTAQTIFKAVFAFA